MLAVPFYLWIVLMALEPVVAAISYVGWTVLFIFFSYATSIRYYIREKYKINGNIVEDFFAVMVLYPFAAFQMEHHLEHTYDLDKPVHEIGHALNHNHDMDGKPGLGYVTPTLSLQDVSPVGPHFNPAMAREGEIQNGHSNWSRTEVI